MIESSRPDPYSRTAIWIFVLVPIVTIVLTETFKTRLIWRIRVVDFFDLVLIAPFMLVMLLFFNRRIFSGPKDKERRLYLIAQGLLGITMYGHAMHLTGNAINTYSTEINQYLDRIPPDTYELVYFFDEMLGHYLLYIGLLGLLGVWMLADRQKQTASWQDYAVGSLLGVSYAVAIIESSQPWLGFFITIWLLFCAWYQSKSGSELSFSGLRQRMAGSYWLRLGVVVAVMLLVGEVLYFIVFGSFIQPSQMGL